VASQPHDLAAGLGGAAPSLFDRNERAAGRPRRALLG